MRAIFIGASALLLAAAGPQPYALVAPSGSCSGWALWDGVTPFAPPGVTLTPDPQQELPCSLSTVPLPAGSTLTTAQFFARFTQAETLAVSAASNASAAINAGLVQGLAAGSVDLTSPTLRAWMDGLVQAGAITVDRETAILTP